MEKSMYPRFYLMLGISFIIMYAVMFANVDKAEHIYISLSRFYVTILMVAPMAVVMLLVMKHMYKDKKQNAVIIISSVILFIAAFAMLRNQTFVDDVQFMKGMIPHHSSAILFSKNADIKDPEVIKLARQIIESQVKEIDDMNKLLEKLK